MNAHISQDQPSAWVVRFAGLIPAGRTLDLACGGGRHARVLAGLGHAVLAVDRDTAALNAASGPGIDTMAFDLEHPAAAGHPDWPLLPAAFAGIVVSNYLHRALMLPLLDSLAPGSGDLRNFCGWEWPVWQAIQPGFPAHAGRVAGVGEFAPLESGDCLRGWLSASTAPGDGAAYLPAQGRF